MHHLLQCCPELNYCMKMMSSTAALINDGGVGRFNLGVFVNCLQCEKCIVSDWLNDKKGMTVGDRC